MQIQRKSNGSAALRIAGRLIFSSPCLLAAGSVAALVVSLLFLCAMISTELHAKIMAEKEHLELNTLAEYVERIFTEHFEGGQISMKAERTLAVQIPAELFERLKEYLAARNLKQKQFLIQLIENALDDTEAE